MGFIGARRENSLRRMIRRLVCLVALCAGMMPACRVLAQAPPPRAEPQIELLSGVRLKAPTPTDVGQAVNGGGTVPFATSVPLPTFAPKEPSPSPIFVQPPSVQPSPSTVNLAPAAHWRPTASILPSPVIDTQILVPPSMPDTTKLPSNSVGPTDSPSRSDQLPLAVFPPPVEPAPNPPKTISPHSDIVPDKTADISVVPETPISPIKGPTDQAPQAAEQPSTEGPDFEVILLALTAMTIAAACIWFYCFGRSNKLKQTNDMQVESETKSALALDQSEKPATASSLAKGPVPADSQPPAVCLTPTLIVAGATRQAVPVGYGPNHFDERHRKALQDRVHEAVWQSLFEDDYALRGTDGKLSYRWAVSTRQATIAR